MARKPFSKKVLDPRYGSNQIDAHFLDALKGEEAGAVARILELYEAEELEERKIELSEKIANCGRPLCSFEETLGTSLDFLANPCNLWASERLEHKKAVLKLAFADRLAYVRNEGFRTPDLALPFKVLVDLKGSKLARPERETSNSLLETLAEWNTHLTSNVPACREAS